MFFNVSHEQLCHSDQVADDREDIVLLKETCLEYIKYVSDPKQKDFVTYLFSKEQMEVLKKVVKINIHVDANGMFVRGTTRDPSLFLKGKKSEKILLYYAVVTTYNGRVRYLWPNM